MKCNMCLVTKTTVGEVRRCDTCTRDGTRSSLPKEVDDDYPLQTAVDEHSGLANRFLPSPDADQKPDINPPISGAVLTQEELDALPESTVEKAAETAVESAQQFGDSGEAVS